MLPQLFLVRSISVVESWMSFLMLMTGRALVGGGGGVMGGRRGRSLAEWT